MFVSKLNSWAYNVPGHGHGSRILSDITASFSDNNGYFIKYNYFVAFELNSCATLPKDLLGVHKHKRTNAFQF